MKQTKHTIPSPSPGCTHINSNHSLSFILLLFKGGDEHKEGDASYRLGLAYEHSGDCETALMVSRRLESICFLASAFLLHMSIINWQCSYDILTNWFLNLNISKDLVLVPGIMNASFMHAWYTKGWREKLLMIMIISLLTYQKMFRWNKL